MEAAPMLAILKQSSAAEEKITKNGITKNVHVVVKNAPFFVVVGSASTGPQYDFCSIPVDCTLVYDNSEASHSLSRHKTVDYVKVKPLEFKAVPTEDGTSVQVELRIKVLTSQHEDMLFRVHIQGMKQDTVTPIPGLEVCSNPIKVISKPEGIKRKPKRTGTAPAGLPVVGGVAMGDPAAAASSSSSAATAAAIFAMGGAFQQQQQGAAAGMMFRQQTRMEEDEDEQFSPKTLGQRQAAGVGSVPGAEGASSSSGGGRKRTLNDMLVETLMNIERRQEEQARILDRVLATAVAPPLKRATASALAGIGAAGDQTGLPPPGPADMDFAEAFDRMMTTYARLSPQERAANVRRIVRAAPPETTLLLPEMIDMFSSEGLGRELGANPLFSTGAASSSSSSQSYGFGGFGAQASSLFRLPSSEDVAAYTSLFSLPQTGGIPPVVGSDPASLAGPPQAHPPQRGPSQVTQPLQQQQQQAAPGRAGLTSSSQMPSFDDFNGDFFNGPVNPDVYL